jgi:hypothetical protein
VGMSIMGVPSIGVHHVNVPYFLLWAWLAWTFLLWQGFGMGVPSIGVLAHAVNVCTLWTLPQNWLFGKQSTLFKSMEEEKSRFFHLLLNKVFMKNKKWYQNKNSKETLSSYLLFVRYYIWLTFLLLIRETILQYDTYEYITLSLHPPPRRKC